MNKFYVDQKQPGFVRGGFYDEMGGMLVGVRAADVCNVLNAAVEWYTAHNISAAHSKRDAVRDLQKAVRKLTS